ncbi:OB-fold nucleic acid binding domain-containing protein [Methanosphaera sp.]
MNDKKMFKISLITTIIGLVGIMILSGYVNPETLTIDKIDKSKIDNQVEINATISSITQTKSNTKIIKLNDETGTINLVIFSGVEINHNLKINQEITVVARVTQYNGNLELILEEPRNIVFS